MREIEYKVFSLKTHQKNWQIDRPNVCQFELTHRCGLHCRHCYTDCYNSPTYFKKDLDTQQVKFILDKTYQAGVIWLCFTGGDPLARRDFLKIYAYSKDKGFIVSVFTNGYSMTKKIAGYFKKKPPFVIEITLNSVTKKRYEMISRVRGSFEKVMRGIDLILQAKLPLKIKTQITKDNLEEVPKIKSFVEGLGLEFRPSTDIYARLDGNLAPCSLRISPQESFKLNGKKRLKKDSCDLSSHSWAKGKQVSLFRCTASGGDGINIDPRGNMFLCNLIRAPYFNLFKISPEYARNQLMLLARNRKFVTASKCRACKLIENCRICPGRAYVEKKDMEAPIDYYCELAGLLYVNK